MDDLNISQEFLEENKKLCQTMPKSRKLGRHTKSERESRRKEVFRLHYDYGYSARKIADLMNVNRNTINGDISYWYSTMINSSNFFNPEITVLSSLKRFETQRTRIRQQLDNSSDFQEQITLEKMIFDIDNKIIQIHQKLIDSTKRVMDLSTRRLNIHLKKNNDSTRFVNTFDTLVVSEKSLEKINNILNNDKIHNVSKLFS